MIMETMDVALQRNVSMRRALLGSNLLSEPLFTLYGFLVFILYKDLGASVFQVTLLTILKPVVTALSFYWSSGLRRKKNLRFNVMWAGIWMRLPFLLCPWFDSVWFVVAAAVNYMFFYRAGMPAWLEMIRKNMPEGERHKMFSWSSALGYIEGVALSLAMGGLLDNNPGLWKSLFAGAALLGLGAVAMQARVPVDEESLEKEERLPLKELLIRPWRDSYRLIRARPDFAKFQWGFMLCGFGVMILQPALPLFAVDTLGITYLEMASAISIAKGLGFALSSPFWARWMNRFNLFQLASAIFIAMGVFPIFLGLSVFGLAWLYLAYFWYGVGQGGSHLVWNMSGPIFAKDEESSRYTGVGVVLAGLRGSVGPSLGGWVAVMASPLASLALGALFSFYGGLSLIRSRYFNPEKNICT